MKKILATFLVGLFMIPSAAFAQVPDQGAQYNALVQQLIELLLIQVQELKAQLVVLQTGQDDIKKESRRIARSVDADEEKTEDEVSGGEPEEVGVEFSFNRNGIKNVGPNSYRYNSVRIKAVGQDIYFWRDGRGFDFGEADVVQADTNCQWIQVENSNNLEHSTMCQIKSGNSLSKEMEFTLDGEGELESLSFYIGSPDGERGTVEAD